MTTYRKVMVMVSQRSGCMSRFASVNKILMSLNTFLETDTKLWVQQFITELAVDAKLTYAIGSGRIVLHLPEDDIVMKIPFTQSGAHQSRVEYEYRHVPEFTDVLEHLAVFDDKLPININPYYEPLITRFDTLINLVGNRSGTIKDLIEQHVIQGLQLDRSPIDYQLLEMLEDIIDNPAHQDKPAYMIGSLITGQTIDELFGSLIRYNFEPSVDICDDNVENFGLTRDDEIIMLDSGIQSEHDFNCVWRDTSELSSTDFNPTQHASFKLSLAN